MCVCVCVCVCMCVCIPPVTQHALCSGVTVPTATPRNVYSVSYNATALQVFWTPVGNNREEMKGRLTGYRVCAVHRFHMGNGKTAEGMQFEINIPDLDKFLKFSFCAENQGWLVYLVLNILAAF